MTSAGRRLAVLGSPIGHSKSPLLHRAAYEHLGLDWSYEAIEVDGARLRGFVDTLDDGWRGLSLTMPLKRDILPMLDRADELATLTGGANTVLLDSAGRSGFNTDVHGIDRALRDHGIGSLDTVQLLGAGATASSVLAAVAGLGATDVRIAARSVARAEPLRPIAEALGLTLSLSALDEFVPTPVDLVVSAVPGSVGLDVEFAPELRGASAFFDIAYDPWPTVLAAQWTAAGGPVISGLEMLVHQAVAQVRIFTTGDATSAVHDEPRMLRRMRASVGLDGTSDRRLPGAGA